MTEPTPDQPTDPQPPSRLRALVMRRPGEEGGAAGRALTIGLAIVLAGAVAVGVVALVSHKGGSRKTADAHGSVNPGTAPQGTTAPPAGNAPPRRPGSVLPPRPGEPGDAASSKKHHRTSAAAPLAPRGAGGAEPSSAIVSYASGRCVDVTNGDGAAGTPLRIWDCDGAARQRWIFASDGTVRSLGLCMSLAGGSSANGTPIQLAHCDGGAAQRFVLKKSLDLVNIAADKCVDVTDQKTTSGTRLQLWQCGGTSNQKWHT